MTRRPGAPIAAPVASGGPLPIAPPVPVQPVVRRGGVGQREEAAAEADRFVDDDRLLRQQRGDGGGDGFGVRGAARRRRAAGRGRAAARAGRRVPRPGAPVPRPRPDRGGPARARRHPAGTEVPGLSGIGEEGHRLARADQDHLPRARQRLDRGRPRHREPDRPAPAPARARAGRSSLAPSAARRWRRRCDGRARAPRLDTALPPSISTVGSPRRRMRAALLDLRRVGARRRRDRQRLGDDAAFVPGRVGRQDQRGDLARIGARRLHRDRRIGADGRARSRVRTQAETPRAQPSVSAVSGASSGR